MAEPGFQQRSNKLDDHGHKERLMERNASALLSGAAVLIAALAGARNGPQRPDTAVWYFLLRKPDHTPPSPFIGVVWLCLEALLVAIGYRFLRAPRSGVRGLALGAWALTLVGLAGYPMLFFRRKRLRASAGVAAAMLTSASGMTYAASKADPPAALMTVPLLVWLGSATVLSEELWRRNPRLSRD